jgi:hypothetical protein
MNRTEAHNDALESAKRTSGSRVLYYNDDAEWGHMDLKSWEHMRGAGGGRDLHYSTVVMPTDKPIK